MRVITRVPRARRVGHPGLRVRRVQRRGKCGTSEVVDIAVNPWVGYEANAGVIGHLLKSQLGFTVEYKDLTEQVSWEGFESGAVDAIVENWGHTDLAKTYITDKKVAVDAGSTGVDGIIGWYVPPWMAERVSGHHRLEQPEQVRGPVQDVGVR